jgi:hypothetical protein
VNQMVFHISFDPGIGQALPGVAAAGPVFGPFLGSVSPVCGLAQGRGVSLYLPADGGGASVQGSGDGTEGTALFEGDGDLPPAPRGTDGYSIFPELW